MPKQKSMKKLTQMVDKFNNAVKVGDQVQLKKDVYSEWETVTVKHPATILSGHSAVGWFEEKRGCYSLDLIKY